MPKQDKTGVKYEKLIEVSLISLGYQVNTDFGKNYINPPKNLREVVIPGTYIQPDFVIREETKIKAIIYVTHWSRKRNSSFKFWRTWEEAAQQKIILGNELLSINCLFEALPVNTEPEIYKTSDDLPRDTTRKSKVPIGFSGWYPTLSWSLVEGFDISLVYPLHYAFVHQINLDLNNSDSYTTELLRKCLNKKPKAHHISQWAFLREIQSNYLSINRELINTHSRFRIGLLHIYLAHRIFLKIIDNIVLNIKDFTFLLIKLENKNLTPEAEYFCFAKPSDDNEIVNLSNQKIIDFIKIISQTYIRSGKNAKTLSNLKTITNPNNNNCLYRIQYNKDLKICLQDIKQHLEDKDFISSIKSGFSQFDTYEGVDEAILNLASPHQVDKKVKFVRHYFEKVLNHQEQLNEQLQSHAKIISNERSLISNDKQNWVFEILLYLCNIDLAEDVYTRITSKFEQFGHELRPHAPFGDDTMLVSNLLKGRNVCINWQSNKKSITLTEDEFLDLSWQAISLCIIETLQAKEISNQSDEDIVKKFLENKSARILSSDLNSLNIIIDYFLGDVCKFSFNDGLDKKIVCKSVFTDTISEIWNGRPLTTAMEGTSNNRKWLIKIQSSQDGHQADKTKELAGRCRAIHISWSHGLDPRNRDEWSFNKRQLPKLALILDGDWSVKNKQNLFEAGWDWVGDVSQLGELRQLIQEETS